MTIGVDGRPCKAKVGLCAGREAPAIRHEQPARSRTLTSSPAIIGLAVMMVVRHPLSLRNVEDLLHERGVDITHEIVRLK